MSMKSMYQWPFSLRSLTKAQIYEAVRDEDWQDFRLSLKGYPTGQKLALLLGYLFKDNEPDIDSVPRNRYVQVVNYINALKRGGLLSQDLEVIK